MQPKLSIVTINRNNAKGLAKTIQSVINQTITNYEFIVIDGASTDNSMDIITEFEDRISKWVSEPDAGIYNAMNKGIKRATGEYLLFLNSGDFFYHNNVLKDVFSREIISDIIYGNQHRIGTKRERIITFPEELSFYHFYTGFLAHNCSFIKRDLFAEIGFYNETYQIVSDHEFFTLAICKYQCSYTYLNMVISTMVDGGISNSDSSGESVKKERDEVFQKHFPAFVTDYDELYQLKYNSFSKRLKRKMKNILKANK